MQPTTKTRIKKLQGSSYVISLEPQDVLGQGSFGKVVRAFDMDHKGEQLVAKIIEINSQSKIESLKIEMKVLEAFQSEHHNLVAFKRLKLFSKKCYYIIMEFCNGGTLEEKINKTKKLSEIEIIDFLSQFCSGYRELYLQSIIHRDIKPQNIMIHNRIYKIADFGLAKIVETLFDKMNLSVKGTPLYMAPEMIKEEAIADPKIDIWSLGIVLYRMLFGGQFPFLFPQKKYSNKEQAFNDILKNPLQIPVLPTRNIALVDMVKKMLEKDPINRMSWEELFNHPLINMKEANPDLNQQDNNHLMNSQLFIQQLIVQKESLIKVQPFTDKLKIKQNDFGGMLGGINKIITEADMSQSKVQERKEKELLEDIMKDLKDQLQKQKMVSLIEDALLFQREQVYFLDKVAFRITCVERILKKHEISFCYVITQIAIMLIYEALLITNDLIQLKSIQKLFSADQVRMFKVSQNWQIFERMILGDKKGLEDFQISLNNKITLLAGIKMKLMLGQGNKMNYTTFKEACHHYFEGLKVIETKELGQLKQLYIVSKYLIDTIDFKQFIKQLGGTMEEFWRYYENIESITETELEQVEIEKLLDQIDNLKL